MQNVIRRKVICEDLYWLYNLTNEKGKGLWSSRKTYFGVCVKLSVKILGDNVDTMIRTNYRSLYNHWATFRKDRNVHQLCPVSRHDAPARAELHGSTMATSVVPHCSHGRKENREIHEKDMTL
jgi:hypothetical protein